MRSSGSGDTKDKKQLLIKGVSRSTDPDTVWNLGERRLNLSDDARDRSLIAFREWVDKADVFLKDSKAFNWNRKGQYV